MAFQITDPQLGFLSPAAIDAGILPPISVSSGSTTTIPTPPLRPGMIVQGSDPTFGFGEFILLTGGAGIAVGTPVFYNLTTFTAAPVTGTLAVPTPIGVSMAANTAATSWSWYQISGIAVGVKGGGISLLTAAALGITTTGVFTATASGAEVQGAEVASIATITQTTVQIVLNRPHMQGRVT